MSARGVSALLGKYRKSTSLDDHYVPDEVVEVMPRHVHPVQVRESSYGVRPLQDHRISAPTPLTLAPDRVDILNKEELWT